ncbi:hypothetical protein MMC07_009179 [Pseudocyphellaria aurata]|nr:hypothetical protein [Pseudocyphellaria aurata]
MDALSVTASIIALLQLSNTVLGYLIDVKGASKDCAKCAVEVANLTTLLLSLRSHLEDESSDELWYHEVRILGVKNGPLDQFKQALEQLHTKMTGGGRLKKVGDALMWKFSKEEITTILGRIERLKTLVQVALQMDHFKLSQAIKECTDTIHTSTEAVKNDMAFIRTHVLTAESRFDAVRQDQDRARHEQLMGWISPTNFPAQQSDFIARRHPGTGQWFLDAPEFTKWLLDPNETLFCHGIPGAGKTTIAATVIDHLLTKVYSDTVGVAYVYCNYKRQVEQNAAELLAAILKQLVQARPSIAEPVQHLHEQHAGRGTKPSLEEIFGALRAVLANYSSAYIAVDALDECPDQDGTRRQFLAKLRDLQSGTDLRLFATSRFIPDIVGKFGAALMLEIRASDEDVRRFVTDQIHRLPRCIQRDDTLQNIVQEKIVQAVDGMFLLARLYVNSLLDKRTKSMVQDTLDTLPKGLEALEKAYQDAVGRIMGQLPRDCALATKALSWITHAQRPLTTKEICHALAVQPDDEELDLDNIIDVEDLVCVCAGLVTVDEKSDIIRLVHYTAQEYFHQLKEEWNLRAQLMIASSCLTYLSFSNFKSGSCRTEKEFTSRHEKNPFLDYAARHWGLHILTVQEGVCELACSFLQHGNLVSCALQAMSLDANLHGNNYNFSWLEYLRFGNSWESTGLHLTAKLGLLYLSKELLMRSREENVISVNSKDSSGHTPLWLAASYGHGHLVKLLVDNGAEVNAHKGSCGNALEEASAKGHKRIVKLLIDNGAEVNAEGYYSSNALTAASQKGHEQIVKLLLAKGADINAGGGLDGNPLQAASTEGHEQIVELLLAKGADVNAGASTEGHEQIVELLLAKGADVNAGSRHYGNALKAASVGGHEQIVKLLLAKGADVNAGGGDYSNALQAASQEGHEQIVELLLAKGADVNAGGWDYGNALQAASQEGHEQIVKLLLAKGADVNAGGGDCRTALQAASARGHEQIVELLLAKGADVNAGGGDYRNALQAASTEGHEQIVELLLAKGADVNAGSRHYGNALKAALKGGHEQVVKLLIDHGARG